MALWTAKDKIDVMARLGDLAEADYRLLVGLDALVELLIDKGVLTRQEYEARCRQTDRAV